MQIQSSQRSYLNQAAQRSARPQSESARGGNGLLDTFRPKYEKLDIHLDQPEYQNIQDLEAANMLGHFTQTMQNGGYPWKLLSAPKDKGGAYKKGEDVSDMEALSRLRKGDAILLQPMRDLQLDLSSNSITALAAASSVGTTELTGLTKMAAYSKNAKVSGGNQGVSVKFGEPVVIENFSQLKLLHQMYDPTEKIDGKSETAKAAHQFSYFTEKTVGSAFPWRFYVKDDSNTFLRVAKHTTKGTATGAAFGGVMGGVLGGILAFGFRDWTYMKAGAALGAAVGGVSGAWESGRTSLKGSPINAVEALENVLNDKEVIFQESRARSLSVPLLGKISWFSDQGKGSKVSDTQDLNTFYYMQSQEDLPKAKKPKKPEKKADPNVVIVDRSVHYHVDNGTEYNIRDTGTKVVLPPNAPHRGF